MKEVLRVLAAGMFALALQPALAAVPSCKLTPDPAEVAPEGAVIVHHTAKCTGAVSVRFYDQLGDILTDRSEPFEVYLRIGSANTSGVTRTFKLSAEACSSDVPAQCVTVSDTVTQASVGAPPPPGPVTAPSCNAEANPASLAASGGIVMLAAACTGSTVGTATWKWNGSVVGISATTAVSVLSNPNSMARTLTFQFTACAAQDASKCTTSNVSVTQAGGSAPPPVAAPFCSVKASPSSLPQGGGVVTLSAACTGASVGSWTWRQGGAVVGQSATASVSVAANAGSARTLTYQLTACAAEDASKCASSSASVTQVGTAPTPTPDPNPTPDPGPNPNPNPPPPSASCVGSAPVVTRTQACPAGSTGSILQQQVFACSNGQWAATASWQTVQSTCAPPGIPMAPVPAVEFYHAEFDHYFLSADPAEIAALDSGRFTGWSRTGYALEVLPPASAPLTDSVPVCRYYGNPAEGLNSHFYSASAQECLFVGERWPTTWLLESSNVFQVVKVDTGSHQCPAGTTTVYRFFNNRRDVNHRYVVSEAVKVEMTARGWMFEGTAFCAVPAP